MDITKIITLVIGVILFLLWTWFVFNVGSNWKENKLKKFFKLIPKDPKNYPDPEKL